MKYLNYESQYNPEPEIIILGHEDSTSEGYEDIGKKLLDALGKGRIIVVDCYPGVKDEEVLTNLRRVLQPEHVIESKGIFFSPDTLTEKMQPFLMEDRVRGVMYYGQIMDFIDMENLQWIKQQLEGLEGEGPILIYGFGAALISKGDLLVYADMTRWEIQLRYRKGMPNYLQENYEEDPLKKYKRGFFVEWRIADRHKMELFDSIDFYLDTNVEEQPKMVTGQALQNALKAVVSRPFRLVPYFDPGVWGGQWMKEVCHLDPSAVNYAWSFDGVPEENCLYFRFGNTRVQTPAMNLVKYCPKELLGSRTFARFGAEYPIRFDFLDTMDGQNLSLQVHPLTEYIKTHFGMTYTQDESYYILDAMEDGGVFLGLKEGIDPEEMIRDLEAAQQTNEFPAEKYVNRFPAKKHDHFLIPAGTVHCSSRNCMVLEVSATPYIFTFKLWDWDRVDLNGVPRPIHIEDGKKVIQFDRTTGWVKANLVNRFEVIEETDAYTEVKTGLHELEFIETHVFTIRDVVHIPGNGEFSMMNLVEGRSAVMESPQGYFEPYTVHYAETFIVPAAAGDFIIRPGNPDETVKVLRANVRFS